MMNTDRFEIAERTINVHTTRPYEWVLENVFSEVQCGKRVRTLFWKSDKPGTSHFFIEFAHKDSVSVAQRSVGAGVTVHVLARNMNMFPIFDCLARGIDPPKKRTNADIEGPLSGDNNMSRDQNSNGPSSAKRPRLYEEDLINTVNSNTSLRDSQERMQHARLPDPAPVMLRDGPQRGYSTSSKVLKPSWSTTDSRRFQSNQSASYQNTQNQKYPTRRYQSNDYQSSDGSVSPPRRPTQTSVKREDVRVTLRDTEPVYANKHQYAHRRASDASTRRASDASNKQATDGTSKRYTEYKTISSDSYSSNPFLFSTASKQMDVDPTSSPEMGLVKDDDNIGAVIDSLKSSLAGPEKWIAVAVDYRRKNLHKKALAVTSSMIEVMKEKGMQKADLRPALLLMAQCHYDIAHKDRSDPESLESANGHFIQLLDWLREAYGSNTPILDAISQAGQQVTLSSTEVDIKPSLPAKPLAFTATGISIPPKPQSALDTLDSSVARLDAVAEENERLRERNSALSSELSAARHACQESENKLRLAETKLTQAQERERHAEMRANRETDARRRMEERFSEERKKWERRAADMREEGARDAMKELSNILKVAANSSGSVLGSMCQFGEAAGRGDRGPDAVGPSSSSSSSAL